MPKDRTDLQKAASRANGLKSTGPVSPSGKARSSRNSLKHGVLSATLLLPGENPDDFSRLFHSVHNEFHPRTEIELTLVQCMVAAQWRLKRIWSLEQAAILHATANSSHPETVITPEGTWSNPAARNADAFQAVHSRSGSGSVLHLAEGRYQRQLNQAIEQFRSLRTSHPAAEIGKHENRT